VACFRAVTIILRLRQATDPRWVDAVLADVDAFLQDHAHNERKVVQAALTLAAQNPGRVELVAAMLELAQEELSHFHQVHDLLAARGQTIGFDQPDPYAGPMHKLLRRRDVNEYLLDRLIVFAVVEARGCEKFQRLADALPSGNLRAFYTDLFKAEARHHSLFTGLAQQYFGREAFAARLDTILDAEAAIVRTLEPRAALH
jgi:tRNA 2-(methylsulfanyl)-N6-isopentenyladenosine37 hydroxylase